MSIFRRSTCAPSGNSPARMRRKRSRFSATLRSRYGLSMPGLRQRAARRAHLLGRLAVDIGEPLLDEPFGEPIQVVVVVGRVIAMPAPVVAQPADRLGDRVLELDFLLQRIGVVVAQVAGAVVLGGEAEVQDDRLGVAVVQVAVGLGRKARDHAPAVLVGALVVGDDGAQEIRRRRGTLGRCRRGGTSSGRGRSTASRSAICGAAAFIRFVHEQ